MTGTGKTIDNEALATEFALGIIAGEGSFYVTFAKDNRRQYGVTPGIRLQIKMGQFSGPLLGALQDHFDLGSVTEYEKGYAWTVSSRAECHALHDCVETHLARHDSIFKETAKYDAYTRWQEALSILEPERKLTKADLLKLADTRDSINRVPNSRARSSSEIVQLIEGVKD
jgi:hypothetical protein